VVPDSAAVDVFEAIATTRAMRRLDPNKDVSDADILKIVEAATKGPSGSNAQPVRWLVVRDADKRRRLGDIYRQCWGPVWERYKQRDGDDAEGYARGTNFEAFYMSVL